MESLDVTAVLLELAVLFALTYVVGGALTRLRIPAMLAALFVAAVAGSTPFGEHLESPDVFPIFEFLGRLGVLMLLFVIGLEIDLVQLRHQHRTVLLLTILAAVFPFLGGIVSTLALGYDWFLALVIALTCIPTAEAVLVPILNEFELTGSRMGQLIIDAGTLDDVIEVALVAIVSLWISRATHQTTTSSLTTVAALAGGLLLLVATGWLLHRWVAPLATRWLSEQPHHLVTLSMVVLFGLGGICEYANLGMVVGAVTAGIAMQPVLIGGGLNSTNARRGIDSMAYGVFGPLFFFWVGSGVDLWGLVQQPTLALLLFAATTGGKLAAAWCVRWTGRISSREAWMIGIGLSARLTTEIIVARLLLDAELISQHVFTALTASASLSALAVPVLFNLMIHYWAKEPELKNSINAR